MAGTVITTIAILLAVIQAALCKSNDVSPDPTKFFPDVKGNLTKIVWAHAVNNRTKLIEALSSEDIMMLEADVVVGNTGNQTDIPIMAHPPDKESDLSLENFLNFTYHNNKKGIKLDFKSDEAFTKSKPILKEFREKLTFPVFLNADIFPGPGGNNTIPLNATEFLKGANETIPQSIISVGWTTRYEKNSTEGRYSSEQLQSMINALNKNNVTQSVTYPVRAVFAANDIDGIKTLLKNTTFTKATLTIWSSEGDSVDAANLSKLIRDVGLDKVYVDVPEDLKNKLELSAASTSSMSSMMINLGASSMALLVLLRML
ncbi:protein FAM151B [Camponotus floridanus]|uniref:protein FAM151B n=1 Tax=Camponotus floridanus TaxID=104421 RepID=UPI00059D0B58|nr:protein FAM151B [Camponotus floridanus]